MKRLCLVKKSIPQRNLTYLDCRFMFVQMRAMSAYHGAFSSNPALVPAVKRPAPIFPG